MRNRLAILISGLVLWAGSACATTLEQLSLAQMAERSTAVVRAKVLGSFVANHKGTLYTYYHVQVIENLKSESQATVDVAVPGGNLNGQSRSVAGAPELQNGAEYVLFLWTSKSGLTQIIGLSQGALDLRTNAAGDTILMRAPVTEQMLDARGRVVEDRGLSIGMSELRRQVRQAAATAKGGAQ